MSYAATEHDTPQARYVCTEGDDPLLLECIPIRYLLLSNALVHRLFLAPFVV